MLELRPLRPADVGNAMALSTQAGWNQAPADWERLLALAPESCFAGTVDGELVATTTVVSYGEASWIGMVLVEEGHRSRGYGSRIFERGLEYAREEGGRIVGLDATYHGESIYEKYGFETVTTVFRWQGELAPDGTAADPKGVRELTTADAEAVAAFDRRRVGADRGQLLRHLLGEAGVRGYRWSGSDGDSLAGYAIVRPGRTHHQIGPFVADREGIRPLLDAIAADFGGSVIVDTPEGDPVAECLEAVGLERDRELVRMTYPDPEPALLDESVRAFTCFAFG